MRNNRSGFTLIEMLTVLAIMGIIMGIGLPSVVTMMKGQALNVATTHVRNNLTYARQYAITQRTKTRVVFPYSATPSLTAAPRYESFAVMDYECVYDTATTSWVWVWKYIGKWEGFPVGARFSALAATEPNNIDVAVRNASMPFPTNYASHFANQPLHPLAYVEFDATGASTKTANETIRICQGVMQNGVATSTGAHNWSDITINFLVGRISVARPQ